MKERVFQPKLLECLKHYSAESFRQDAVAGLTVGVVALPLAMAFAIASGVPPQAGLYTAVIAGFLISVLGGTRVSIGGPTGAFVVILYGIHQQFGPVNLAACTILAGVILLIMGAARLGAMIKYIPYPVTMGFTSGIAVVIFSTQVKDFLGLQLETNPADFMPKLIEIGTHLSTTHGWTLGLAAGALGLIRWWPAGWGRIVPGTIVALLAGTILVMVTQADGSFGLETIGSRFGGIPQGLPRFSWPAFDWAQFPDLIRPATTIALLAAIESLLCAVVADGMIEDRHHPNTELIAQGLANIASPLFGGIAATGAIARTATNVKIGGRTPVAGMIHAAVLLMILLVAAPLAKFIPLAVLSAVLVNVALNMGEWHLFLRLRKWPRSDAAVFLTTFALTVFFDLTIAVEVGMVLAAVLFIRRIASVTNISALESHDHAPGPGPATPLPPGVMIYHIKGVFFFGAADKLETALKRAGQEPRVLILNVTDVLSMDATGLNALEDLHAKLRRRHRHLLLVGSHTQPYLVMERAGLLDAIGRDNLMENIPAALDRARELL